MNVEKVFYEWCFSKNRVVICKDLAVCRCVQVYGSSSGDKRCKQPDNRLKPTSELLPSTCDVNFVDRLLIITVSEFKLRLSQTQHFRDWNRNNKVFTDTLCGEAAQPI